METIRLKPAEGYEKLEKMGVIREVDWRLVGRETARAWREAAAVSEQSRAKSARPGGDANS